MKRLPLLLAISALLVAGTLAGSTEAQSPDPEATIAALQTRVAVLESELPATPTPTSDESSSPIAAQNRQRTVGGTALDLIPLGTKGELSLVAVGSYSGPSSNKTLPFVVRNNTSERLEGVSVAATARDLKGNLVASGEQVGVPFPYQIGPGEIAFGTVGFDNVPLVAGTTFDLVVQARPARSRTDSLFIDLDITELSVVDGRLLGTVTNSSYQATGSLSYAVIACISEEGRPLGVISEGLNPDRVDAAQSATFQSVLPEGRSCPLFLVAAHG